MLDFKNAWSDKNRSPVEKKQGLMKSLFSELKEIIVFRYLGACINLLSDNISKADPVTEADYNYISKISNNMMSVLLTLGMPLTECYLIYVRTLAKPSSSFEEKFQSWADKVNVTSQEFIVNLRIENDKLYDMLSTTNGGIKVVRKL